MKLNNFYILTIIGLLNFITAEAQTGQELYKSNCIACHTIGGGKLVGPDLKGISGTKPEKWLIQFIKSSGRLIKSGDPEAIKIFREYAGLPMPDQNLSETEIKMILDYIRDESKKDSADQLKDKEEVFTIEQIESGSKLFNGTLAFRNKGAACNSCHSINDKRIIVGGNMAKDLNLTYKNMGTSGIKAILSSPPFPSMAQAYRTAPLTKEEITNLTAFIKYAGNNPSSPEYGFFGPQFGMYGILLFILLNIFIVIYLNQGKKDSVNKEILKRQAKTH